MNIEIPDIIEYVKDPTFVDARQALLDGYDQDPPDFFHMASKEGCAKLLSALRDATTDDVWCCLSYAKSAKQKRKVFVEVNLEGVERSDGEKGDFNFEVTKQRIEKLSPDFRRSLITGAYSNNASALRAEVVGSMKGSIKRPAAKIQEELFALEDRYAMLIQKWEKKTSGGSALSGS